VTEELVVLASTVGTTLVGLMATDAWGTAKTAFVDLWGRHHPEDANAVGTELDTTRAELLDGHQRGDSRIEVELTNAWRSRVSDLLAVDPDAANEMRRFVDSAAAAVVSEERVEIQSVEMHAEARDHGRNYQLGQGTQNIG
jgi:hypothetical protein